MAASPSEVDLNFAKLMGGQEDPWMDLDNEEVLQRALASSFKNMPLTPQATAGFPRTPYGRGVRPEPQATCGGNGGGSRLRPFPPPQPMHTQTYFAADLNPAPSPLAGSDPYQQTNSVDMATPQGSSGQPMTMPATGPTGSASSVALEVMARPSRRGRQ